MRVQLTATRIWIIVVAVPTMLAPSATSRSDDQPTSEPTPPAGGPTAKAAVEASVYSDTDAVRVWTPTISGTVADETAGWSINGRYLVDAVSAASVDVVSAASGKWFEYRHVGSGAIDYKTGGVGLSLSGGISREPDYISIGGGGSISVELMNKNVTPSLGISGGHDIVGRTGLPAQYWQTMNQVGLQPGVTFVVGRSTIAAITFDGLFQRGYLAKPYRYVPIFSPEEAEKIGPGATVDEVNLRRLDARPIDQLPAARDRYALTGRLAHRFDHSTLRVDERLYTDSWNLRASTTDLNLYLDAGRRFLLWPHIRFHGQQAISLWQRAYQGVLDPDGNLIGIPRYRTGDRELGSLYTVTLGGGLRFLLTTETRVPWAVTLTVDAARTRFLDALYITKRHTVFTALNLEAGL